jgi:DNA-binding HxlR family transcriptional regulator
MKDGPFLPDVLSAECPSRVVLNAMTSRWGVLVLLVLSRGTHRFAQLRRRIGGVSERMLAQTLQHLEQHGLVHRRAFDVVPPHVEYSLTEAGDQAAARVAALVGWIEGHVATGLHRRAEGAAAAAAL